MSKQIAAQVGLSEITVKVHRSHVMKKMGQIGGRSGQDGGRTGGEVRRAQGPTIIPRLSRTDWGKPPSLRLLVAEQQGVQCRKGTATPRNLSIVLHAKSPP